MGKLLLKLAAILGVPILLLYSYVLIFPTYYMDKEYTSMEQQKDYVNKNNSYNDILIIGDSTAKADMLAYDIGNMSVYNISLEACTSVESYVSMRNYLKSHSVPETVIMIFSPMSLASNEYFYTRILYCGFYSRSEMTEMYKKGRELNDPYWNADGVGIDILRYYLRDPVLFLPAIRNSNFFGRYDVNTGYYKQLEQDKGWMTIGNADESYEQDFIAGLDTFEVLPMQNYYFHQLIDLCEENDIEVIIEQAPIKESSVGEIRENVISEYEEYFRQLKKDHPDITVNSSLVYYGNEYFGDYAHLNIKGAEKFTEEIFDKYFADEDTAA